MTKEEQRKLVLYLLASQFASDEEWEEIKKEYNKQEESNESIHQ